MKNEKKWAALFVAGIALVLCLVGVNAASAAEKTVEVMNAHNSYYEQLDELFGE